MSETETSHHCSQLLRSHGKVLVTKFDKSHLSGTSQPVALPPVYLKAPCLGLFCSLATSFLFSPPPNWNAQLQDIYYYESVFKNENGTFQLSELLPPGTEQMTRLNGL